MKFDSLEGKTIHEIIEKRLNQASSQKNNVDKLEVTSRINPIRASFAQERLWYLHQLQPNDTSYNTYFAFTLSGDLDELALKEALNMIVQRHESLRTTFREIDGKAFQIIVDSEEIKINFVDLSNTRFERQFLLNIVNTPFSLQEGPLFQVHLIKLEASKHILLFNMHHIIFDGWSAGIFMDELTTLYEANVKGDKCDLVPIKYQYADFSNWQRKHLTVERMGRYLKYWADKLKGAPPYIELPYDKMRPSILNSEGDLYKIIIPEKIANEIRNLSKKEGVTLFMTLLSAFYILIYKYTKQKDIVIGSPIAARTSKEIESIIGFFVNMVCLRGEICENQEFKSFLREVMDTCIEAYSNQDLPFEKLIEELQPERDLSRTPIFQVMFELQHGSHTFSIEGLEVNSIEDSVITSKYDLSIIIEDLEDGSLVVNFEYSTNLFNRDTIVRMANNFQNIIKNVIANPDAMISEIEVMTKSEKDKLLLEWTDTKRSFVKDKSFFELFIEQVTKTPNNIAVMDEEGTLTYKEIYLLSNEISKRLMLSGASNETVVGLLGNRDRYYLASILAIFQVGGVYLPLDPNYPIQRIKHILQQSKCKTILFSSTSEEEVQNLDLNDLLNYSVQTVNLDEIIKNKIQMDLCSIAKVFPENLAYIIFTSGSTGLPKGTMIEHRNMMNHLFSKIVDLKLTSRDTVAQTASQCFDISIWQFLTTILVGGRIRIYSDQTVMDPTLLLEKVKNDRVTVMETTPSYLKLFIEEAVKSNYCNQLLRFMLVTGEQSDSKLLKNWIKAFNDTEIINAYGPAECADDVTMYRVNNINHLQPGIAPIGKAINNIKIYILDNELNLLPIGSKGEIFVGGAGVGRGYINNPKATANKFLPDPYSNRLGERLYRTGDLGRYRMDGTIEFLGRIDNQIKIRGFRIEIEEVEVNLLQHDSISDVVVTIHIDKNMEKYLIAYVVLEQGNNNITDWDLRDELEKKIPKYMIPSQYIFMDKLPLSPNGKIDRKLLPIPNVNNSINEFIPISTDTEKALALIWTEVLGEKNIGKRDNFFNIGGHSLLAIQVISRSRVKFNVPLPVSSIFEVPTLGKLADYIDTLCWVMNVSQAEH
jgi:amino acid adenylation domain-containing protein